MKTRSIKKRRFSLIELLVVIGIIGILSAIILPAISGSKKAADKTKASAQVRQIAMAISNYLSDYQSLPCADASGTSDDLNNTLFNDNYLSYLNGGNARGKVYYSGSTKNHKDEDIYISFDNNYDQSVGAADGYSNIPGVAAVYTTIEGDKVRSWEK